MDLDTVENQSPSQAKEITLFGSNSSNRKEFLQIRMAFIAFQASLGSLGDDLSQMKQAAVCA